MGELENCEICDLPVLELDGQFSILQPYGTESSEPAFSLVGWVHTPCLARSPLRAPWFRWRVDHFRGDRGYELAREADGWAVLCHRRLRSMIAFHSDGASISAEQTDGRMKPCNGGGSLQVERDSHITIADPEFIASVHHELEINKRVNLQRIVANLGIQDKLQWPPVLEAGEYMFQRQLRRDWSRTSFSARLRYRKFLPDVVLAVWESL